MKIVDEIRSYFADGEINIAYTVHNIDSRFPAWVIRFPDRFGVAVPYIGKAVCEKFANASLKSENIQIGGKEIDCLVLASTIELTRNEFAMFCRDYLYPGENGEKRNSLLQDPIEWWKHWKLLIGNSIIEKKPYAVLGELIIYEYLLQEGRHVTWEGPKASSHDLVSVQEEYEVKSTLARYEKTIHISGQFQLQNNVKRLYVYFCRFEKNCNGISIDSIVEKLVQKYGESREEINAKLNKLGYGIGNSARKEKYQIHEVLRYTVDEKFPKIVPESFVGNKLPQGIKHISYDVDLNVLEGINIDMRE